MSAPGNAGPIELTARNIADYLRERPEFASAPAMDCRDLGGGVSNNVVLVEMPGQRIVVKQALPQLRVQDEWLADRGRIFRERDALIDSAKLLPRRWVPEVLFSDEANFVYAMTAAEEPAEFWKNRLLSGKLEPELARRAGLALGLTIRGTWRVPFFEEKFGDQTAFDQLRIDPYYRTIARRNPDIADFVNAWLPKTAGYRYALTHGDWSPKNMMVTPSGMVFIDYECAHFGDPSYDAAFAINHLVLKAFHRPALWDGYIGLARIFFTWTLSVLPVEALDYFESATATHLGMLMLARVDGKSPAEYITTDEKRGRIRRAAKSIIREQPSTLERCFAIAR